MSATARALILATLMTCPALAASPTVGQPAPDFGSANWVMNAPEQASIEALRGEVVFVEKWGVKCPPCVALIPHIEQLQQTYGERGLHIFAFEAQNHSAAEVVAKITEKGGKTYPVSAGGGNAYQGDGTIPVAWLIGVDGTVIWQGNPSAERQKLDGLIEAEVAKVRYPGLGKSEVDEAVVGSARAYMQQDLAGAREQAQDVLGDEQASEQARADAQFMLDKVEERSTRQWAQMEAHREAGRYLEAYQLLEWFTKAFKKAEEGDRAKDLLKEFKRDKQLKKELNAAVKLERLLSQLEGQPAEVRAGALESFAANRKYEGTAAARRAAELR